MNTITTLMMNSIKSLITEDQVILPTLPEVAMRAREVSAHPDATLPMLAKAIRSDAAICARLIKVANSPFIQRVNNRVNDIETALCRLGLHFACNLVTGLAMEQMFHSESKLVAQKLSEVWEDSTRIAGQASIIAKHFSSLPPSEAALAGLFHQIGVLPILTVVEKNAGTFNQEAELDVLITDLHPTIGQHILRTWHFPDAISQTPEEYLHFQRHNIESIDYSDIITIAYLYDCSVTGHADHRAPSWDKIPAFQRANIAVEPGAHHASALNALRSEFEAAIRVFR